MRWIFAVALTMTMLAASIASAQEHTLTIGLGEAASLQFDETGRALTTGRTRAGPLSAFEQTAARSMLAGAFDQAVGEDFAWMSHGKDDPAPPPPTAGVVLLRFVQLPGGDHVVLFVENGYGMAFSYRATMSTDGQTQTTDVCIVTPNRRGAEHWPFRIDRLELTEFRQAPWRDGDPVPCR